MLPSERKRQVNFALFQCQFPLTLQFKIDSTYSNYIDITDNLYCIFCTMCDIFAETEYGRWLLNHILKNRTEPFDLVASVYPIDALCNTSRLSTSAFLGVGCLSDKTYTRLSIQEHLTT